MFFFLHVHGVVHCCDPLHRFFWYSFLAFFFWYFSGVFSGGGTSRAHTGNDRCRQITKFDGLLVRVVRAAFRSTPFFSSALCKNCGLLQPPPLFYLSNYSCLIFYSLGLLLGYIGNLPLPRPLLLCLGEISSRWPL